MIALASVWMGFACLLLSLVMWIWRPAMTDVTIWLVLWLGAPGTLCLAGIVLWSYRKRSRDEKDVAAQRLQCTVGIILALAAAAVVYTLIIRSEKIPAGLLDEARSSIIPRAGAGGETRSCNCKATARPKTSTTLPRSPICCSVSTCRRSESPSNSTANSFREMNSTRRLCTTATTLKS